MSTEIQITNAQLGGLSLLFGPLPVLSTEDLKLYDQMWNKLTECLKPVDMMALLLIRRIHDETWLVCRYSRHKALVVDRRFRESLEFQLKRRKEQKARREVLARELVEKTGRPISELARLERQDAMMRSNNWSFTKWAWDSGCAGVQTRSSMRQVTRADNIEPA